MFMSSDPRTYRSASEVKSKAKTLGHFKNDPALKIDTNFHNNLDLYTYITRKWSSGKPEALSTMRTNRFRFIWAQDRTDRRIHTDQLTGLYTSQILIKRHVNVILYHPFFI